MDRIGIDKDKLLDIIEKLLPLLNGDAGAYLGTYSGPAADLCELVGDRHSWSVDEREG